MSRNLEEQEAKQREEAAREQPAPQNHVRHRVVTMAWWSACGVVGVLGFLVIVGTLGAPNTPGDNTGDGLFAGAVLLVLGVLFGFLAWRSKPVRAHEAGRFASQPFTPSNTPEWLAPPTGAPVRAPAPDGSGAPQGEPTSRIPMTRVAVASHRSSRSWRRGRLGARGQLILFGVLFVILAIATPGAIGDAQRSGFTQSHGVAVAGQASDIQNTESCDRYGNNCTYTFAATVFLDQPVGGQATTTVHGVGQFPGFEGSEVTVLVDPHDPSYAEIRGNKLDAKDSWLVAPIGALICGLLAGLGLMRRLRQNPGRLPNHHLGRSSPS